ncbi:MAG: ribonuclease HII [Chitinophagales bacterium]|nr:ribonuclease HII [Chitinophagales bacterium]MDW8427097.1 ribonuclease HII [Chitinophagales bacterium]
MSPALVASQGEAGCDEAGRGALAGPVVAAAVVLPPGYHHPLCNDSKKLSPRQRQQLRPLIEQAALAWAIGVADVAEINRLNILRATLLAMHRALDALHHNISLILVDGNRFFSYKKIPHRCIIHGDGTYISIAAASILAKTHRDQLMEQLHQQYPCYNWQSNKGYGTREHCQALITHGPCPQHRIQFLKRFSKTAGWAHRNIEVPLKLEEQRQRTIFGSQKEGG